MIAPFFIGEGDRLPYYRVQVRDENGVVSLTDIVAVTFRMKSLSTGSVLVSSPGTITDYPAGEAEYRWAAADTAVTGEFACSFEFLTNAGLKYTLPRNTIAKIIVESREATG